MLYENRNIELVVGFLVTSSILILQRIDFAGTSLGLLVLLAALIINVLYLAKKSGNITIHVLFFVYILSLLPFFLSLSYTSEEATLSFLRSIVAPLLVAFIIFTNTSIITRFSSHEYGQWLLILLGIVFFGIMANDAISVFIDEGKIKKVYSFGNPNYLAFCILVLQNLWLYLYRTEKISVLKTAVFYLSTSLAILLSFSKSAYVVEVLFVMYVVFGNKITIKHLTNVCITVVFMFFLITYFMIENEFLISSISFLSDDIGHGTSSRFVHASLAFSLFTDNFIFGLGRDGYLLYSGGYKTHNIILTLMADNGIIGLFFYTVFCFVAMCFIAVSKVNCGLIVITLLNYLIFIHTHADGELLIATPLLLFITCIQLKVDNGNSFHNYSGTKGL
jgi:hypothetical protein